MGSSLEIPKKMRFMLAMQRDLKMYYTDHGVYPEYLDSLKWTMEVLGNGGAYEQLQGGKSFILRSQLEAGYTIDFDSMGDLDGVQGSLDCSDGLLYFCLEP